LSNNSLERQQVLGLHFTSIIDSRGCNVGMTQPFLDLGDIGFVIEVIRRRSGAQYLVLGAANLERGRAIASICNPSNRANDRSDGKYWLG